MARSGGSILICEGRFRGEADMHGRVAMTAWVVGDSRRSSGRIRGTGRYGIFARCVYSGLMPANFTTLAHFSVSSAMNFPKSADEPAHTAHPRSMRRGFILG